MIQNLILQISSSKMSSNEEEIWKDIPKEFKLNNYEISSLGRIRNKTTKYIFRIKPNIQGYIVSRFNIDGGSKHYSHHMIVAKAFIANPDNKPTVNHKNKVRYDNRVSNLEWATRSEQNTSVNKTISSKPNSNKKIRQLSLEGEFIKIWNSISEAARYYNISVNTIGEALSGRRDKGFGFKWEFVKEEANQEEIWKKIPLEEGFEEAYASNLGRIKTKNKLHFGSKDNTGYYSFAIFNNKTKKHITFKVHRLVCMAFHSNPEKKPFVNHKDLDPGNNKADNLEWNTPKENTNHYLDNNNRTRSTPRSRVVLQYDLDGNFLAEFNSLTEAGKASNTNYNHIRECCTGERKKAGGFSWKFKD